MVNKAEAEPQGAVAPVAEPVKGTAETAQARLDKFLEEQAKELTVDDLQLSEEFKCQARKFLQAASRHNKAVHVLALVKAEVESVEADGRSSIVSGKEKKPTEGEIAGQLANDPAVQVARRKRAFAEMQSAQYHSVVRAWEHKRDMLVQLGSTHRAEMQAGISMREPDPPAAGGTRRQNTNPALRDDYFEE